VAVVTGRLRTARAYTTDPDIRIGHCEPCDKVIYLSRKTARIAARRLWPDPRPRAYRCPDDDRYWHLGHVADSVRRGHDSRDEWLGRIEEAKR
jgi:hypothetical protein